MTRRKSKYPPTFYEWVVGTTIESALGPIPKKKPKPRRRGVVRVEISTDDESAEDSVRITYPRTQPRENLPRKEVKKVRFQEQVPRKSALKKKTQVVSFESESEEVFSDSATDGSSSEPTASAQSVESSGTSSEASSDVETTSDENETTGSDSEPPPSCKCRECYRRRRKSRQRQTDFRKHREGISSSDSKSQSESESETDNSPKVKCRKHRKRSGKKAESHSETDTETSESYADTSNSSPESSEESEQEVKKKKKNSKKEKKKARTSKKGVKFKKSSDDSEEEGSKSKKKKSSKEDAVQTPKQNNTDRSKKDNYPEANPLPHPRRPNYVAPVRAEVVQTERVIETPDDPPPNAYYDAEHNIIRVYQGPVYGGNPSRSLYPKRDSTMRPLPVGMPHPTQNQYYHGFNAMPPKKPDMGDVQVPITQGMPVNAWHAAYAPPGLPYEQFNPGLGNLGAFNGRGAWHDSAELNSQKNALSRAGGGHNIGPGSESNKARTKKKVTFATEPQLTRYQSNNNNNNRASVFQEWGKRSSPNGSQQDAKEPEPNGGSNSGHTSWYHGNKDGPQSQIDNSQNTSGDGNTWGQNDNNNRQSTDGGWNMNAAGNSGGDGDAGANNDQWGGASGNDPTWDAPPDNTNTWGDGDNNNNANANANCDDGNEDNNVAPQNDMPGSFPDWTDPNAAASTNGQVDEPGWDNDGGGPAPATDW